MVVSRVALGKVTEGGKYGMKLGEPLALKTFLVAEQPSMNAMTGVVGHGHAHQVRQGKPIIRKISDPEKDNKQGSVGDAYYPPHLWSKMV